LKPKLIAIPIIVIIFYGIILLYSDLNEILKNLSQINYSYLALCFPLFFIWILITSLRFQIILHKLDISLRYFDSFLVYTSGLSMIITPGASGSIIKSYILKKKLNKSISSTTPIVFYEKWLELVSIVVVIGILLFYVNYLESQIVFIIGLGIMVFTFVLFRYSIGLEGLNKLLNKTRFTKKFIINSDEFKKTSIKLCETNTLIKVLLLSLLSKVVIIGVVALAFKALNVNLDIFSGSQIYFTSILIGLLTLIPGGIIITEAGMFGLLLQNNVEATAASLAVLVIRAITFWFPFFVGVIVLRWISKRVLKKTE